MKPLAVAAVGGKMKQDCEKKTETTIEMAGDLQQSPKSSIYGHIKEGEVNNPALEMEFRCPIFLGLLFAICLATFLPSPSYQSLALYCLFLFVLARLGSAEQRYNKYLLKNKTNKTQPKENE